MTNVWQAIVSMTGASGSRGVGLDTQNVLWSDADVFAAQSESGGNALMYAMTERALQLAEGLSFGTPIDLLDQLLGTVYAYGQRITGQPDLRRRLR
ncbi:MAG: hypothetical protein BRD40_04055 [Bacteroidetes bacterium QS_1_65_9]|nr:MAG: hypothetical protein BRD40_04055 [Bacteroidetes bacterium QS_1_65_9]